ncbi:MAG: cation:proton antiporter, partial [Phascolarctobacterium sp.]|nr:cation:proton antiporter [Phascolarctobacterium sp.]
MAHLPTIITDLAMILLVAGITTILFKKLIQPLVLGYIIAGFITGPHFNFFPTVTDTTNIQAWSEIGVIFLLFALGLEFSFYKLKSVGNTAFIATAVEIGGMLGMGYLCGTLLGWSHMDSIFLGGMLAMSSTTIIIKAFEDLKLKGKRFTEMVFGILIVEDIAGIIMMVMLSTLAAAGISSMELAMGVGRLAFFLTLWFVMGM